MKFAATTFISLLLLGVCCARSPYASESPLDASEAPQMDDSSKYAQTSLFEGKQSKAENQNSQPWAQLKDIVHQKFRDTFQQLTSDKLQARIHKAFSGIQPAVSINYDFSIDLTSDDKEMVYNQLHAQITSVKLYGIDQYYLANNQMTSTKPDQIHAEIRLVIDRTNATAVVSIHKGDDENSPFQKINVDFDIEQLTADLSIEKADRESAPTLLALKTSLIRIRPMGIEKFEGEVQNLIKEKLAGHMKRYVEEGLKKFMQEGFIYLAARGVFPPNVEKRSA